MNRKDNIGNSSTVLMQVRECYEAYVKNISHPVVIDLTAYVTDMLKCNRSGK